MTYTVPRTARTRNPYTHVSAHHMLRVGLLTDMRLGRRTDTRTHTRAHFSIYLLLRVRPRSRELLLSAAKRAGCPLLSCSLLSEKGLARPLMDASWILRRRGTRAVSGGRLVVGGLVCEARGREYACGGVDLMDISFQQRSASGSSAAA